MNNPICKCGVESVFVDNGPRMQYHYCRDCKIEVIETSLVGALQPLMWTFPPDSTASVPVSTTPAPPLSSPPTVPVQHQFKSNSLLCAACGLSGFVIYQHGLNSCTGAAPSPIAPQGVPATVPPPPPPTTTTQKRQGYASASSLAARDLQVTCIDYHLDKVHLVDINTRQKFVVAFNDFFSITGWDFRNTQVGAICRNVCLPTSTNATGGTSNGPLP